MTASSCTILLLSLLLPTVHKLTPPWHSLALCAYPRQRALSSLTSRKHLAIARHGEQALVLRSVNNSALARRGLLQRSGNSSQRSRGAFFCLERPLPRKGGEA